MSQPELVCAGRSVLNARDNIRRYCGLAWSGGDPEIWAYENFDLTPTGLDDLLGPADYLAAAVIHPGFGNDEMSFFRQAGGNEACEEWLSLLPRNLDLADAVEATLVQLGRLSEIQAGRWLSITSKVMHRKRPVLVPLFDRAVADWYRPVTGQRGIAGWPALVREMHSDLAAPANRSFLADVAVELSSELSGGAPSELRLMDIAIWMGSHAR